VNTARSLLAGVAVLALSGLVAGPAQAATQHCPGHNLPGSGKVETSGSSNTVKTKLPDGTSVCVKAGTEITYVTVVNGKITQTAITNKKGKPLGISYYVPGEEEEPPCVDDPKTPLNDCEEPPAA
jgi:hypothetical protein